MSDESIDRKILEGTDIDLGDLGETDADGSLVSTGEEATTGAARPDTGGARRRLTGLLALLLGVIGILVSIFVAAYLVRFGFGAGTTAEERMEPVEASIERMEVRIDQTDDLIDRRGVEAAQVGELQARADGLVDVSTAAVRAYEAVDDHPVYRYLPADLSELATELAEFETTSSDVAGVVNSVADGADLGAAEAGVVADQLDEMQAEISSVRDVVDAASSSLSQWLRIGSFAGFLGSLCSMWAFISLARRGWRSLRGQPI